MKLKAGKMDNKHHELEQGVINKQKETCKKYGAQFLASPFNKLIGVAIETFNTSDTLIINGLRHPIESEQSSNWYIWAGEEFSDADDFFKPMHIFHLVELCPKVLNYLGLPPGWRFLFDNQYEDVWYDESLLNI